MPRSILDVLIVLRSEYAEEIMKMLFECVHL